jgi:hypothetical protein
MSYRIHAQKENTSSETGTFTFTHMPKGILQRQKTGFKNDEERMTIIGLKRELLQKIGEYMDAMSRGAL